MIVEFTRKDGQANGKISGVMSLKFVGNKNVEIRKGDEFSKPTATLKRSRLVSVHEEANGPLGGLSL